MVVDYKRYQYLISSSQVYMGFFIRKNVDNFVVYFFKMQNVLVVIVVDI